MRACKLIQAMDQALPMSVRIVMDLSISAARKQQQKQKHCSWLAYFIKSSDLRQSW